MLGWPSAPLPRVLPAHEKVPIPPARAMVFPATPPLLAVTVTTAPLDVAVTDEAAALRLMASFRFVAMVVVSADVAKLEPVFVPSVPPVSVLAAHEKPVKVYPSEMLLPAVPLVRAVTVVVLLLVLALTPKAVGHALIAVVRFVASVPVVLLIAKVPEGDAPVPHALEPFAPAVRLLQPKFDVESLALRLMSDPGVVMVTVTLLLLPPLPCTAVKPTEKLVLQELIALVRFAAEVLVVHENT